RTGINKAEQLRLRDGTVTDAKTVLEEEKDKVRKALREAIPKRDGPALRTNIAKGEALNMGTELFEAKKVLEEMQVAARQHLKDAVESRKVDSLTAAIERGEEAGLKESELAEARRVLKEEQ
ncbi:unnamed protein product, partial [Effrenium voratum]